MTLEPGGWRLAVLLLGFVTAGLVYLLKRSLFGRIDKLDESMKEISENSVKKSDYKESGIEEYQFLGGTEHSGSCTCSELNGRVFRVDEAEPGVNLPPIHPNCLCIIRAYFKKSVFAKREGNPLDGNIKFEEWKKKYAS